MLRFLKTYNMLWSTGPNFMELLSRKLCLANFLAKQNFAESQSIPTDIAWQFGWLPGFAKQVQFCAQQIFVLSSSMKLGPGKSRHLYYLCHILLSCAVCNRDTWIPTIAELFWKRNFNWHTKCIAKICITCKFSSSSDINMNTRSNLLVQYR